MMRCFRSLALVIALAGTSSLEADEPQKKDQQPEPLPAPKELIPSVIRVLPAAQPGTREIWQYYGVDSRGRFLPRVIYSPNGSFYSRDGRPYPWAPRPMLFMPYVSD